MDAYTTFAQVYDLFMDNVPYEEWSEYLLSVLKEYGIHSGVICDLGCGTGKMTRLLAQAGYDMIGIDNSEEMLAEAMEKRAESGHDILYLLQDMQDFELYGTVRAVISVCDSMNYLTDEEDLEYLFALVNNYLDPQGIFLFDINTVYKYQTMIGNTTIAENRDEGSFIWENYFDEESSINEYALTLFVKQENGLFARFEEFHYQRAYETEEVADLIRASGMEQAGLTLKAVCAEGTTDPADENCERAYFVAVRTQPHVF